MRYPTLLSALLLLAAACATSDRAQLQVGVQGHTDVLRPALTVTASANGFQRTWRGPEIASPALPNHAAPVETPHRGTLTVRVRLVAPPGADTVAAQLQLDLRPDWAWGVDIELSDHDPAMTCFGCTGVKAYAVPSSLRQSSGDSLYLVWGGNSIAHPVVY